MSHNVLTVNTSEPDRDGDISATINDGVIFSYRGETGPVSIGYPAGGYSAGDNVPWYIANASYYELYTGTGVSFNWSSFSPLSSSLAYAFKDEISLPSGDYELQMSYAPYGNTVGTLAWVENDATATRIGPMISTSTARQVTYCRFKFSAASAIDIGCRILTGAGNGSSFGSILSMSCLIRKL